MTSSTINIPIRLVLNSISESEAGGNSLVSPKQQRRRVNNHGLPSHPHRRRKVSAPPELQQHLGGTAHFLHPSEALNVNHQKGHSDKSPNSSYILSFSSGPTNLSEGVYSGSDSGVPSEYSSYAAPVSRVNQSDTSSPDDTLAVRRDSLDDLEEQRDHQPHSNTIPDLKFYNSDSETESIDDLQSPPVQRKSDNSGGITNPGYIHTEHSTLVLPVGSPPLHTSSSAPNMTSPAPSVVNLPGVAGRNRANSMVVQLNLQGGMPPIPGLAVPAGSARSVSMVSLNASQPIAHLYPNLPSDSQSIYSEVGMPYTQQSATYLQPQNAVGGGSNTLDSQANMQGLGIKVIDDQHNRTPSHAETIITHTPDHGDDEPPQPTEPEEKKKWFMDTLSENLSVMYAVFLVMLGVVIYLADTFSGHDSAIAEGFNVYLIVAQLLWLFYVHIDVRRYVNVISRALEEAKSKEVKNDQVQLEPTGDGQYQLRINLPERKKTIPQYYGFTSGRHGGSLYLKIGATIFCFGYLTHTGLELGQKILYLTEDDPAFDDCTCTTDVIMSVLQPVYAFYQLFFIFKYSNLIINRRVILSKFGIMHCIGASLCFWTYTILQETLQAIFKKKAYKNDYLVDASSEPHALPFLGGALDESDEMDDEDHHYTGNKLPSSSAWSINYGCEKDTKLSAMINYTTPYLFPFSIEFNILMTGFWILLWENLGKTDRHTHIPSVEVTYEEDNSKSLTSNLIIYVDCHASNRGLFAGLLLTVATVISIILFFIFTSAKETVTLGMYVNGFSEIILLSIMLVTAVIAFYSIRVLDVIKHHVSSVDDILLYCCLPCIFLYAFLSLVPYYIDGKGVYVTVAILQVAQVILQTALICDGLRRCSNSSTLQHVKPGREFITFLVVTNVAMWLLQTFEIKSEEGNSVMYEFYGKELWTLLSHLTLPLALFYRFHSSVCLADMWKASYEREESH